MNADRRELLVQIAKMYYLEDESQEQIAKKLFISRSSISRLLKTCRDLGIVEIRIHENEDTTLESQIQQKLKERFNLKDVIVIPSDQEKTINRIRLGVAASNYLESNLEEGMLLGVSWGSSLHDFVQAFNPIKPPKADVVQLIGGVGARKLEVDGMELVKDLAKVLRGKYYVLQVPLIVQSKQLCELILSEYDVDQTLKKAAQADIAIVGIGSNYPEISALVKTGYLTGEESEALRSTGAVGDICGRQIDRYGNLCESEIDDRIIGIRLETLKKINTVVGVAAGEKKSEAILGALRGKYINVLITDMNAALQILNLDSEQVK